LLRKQSRFAALPTPLTATALGCALHGQLHIFGAGRTSSICSAY